MPFTSDWESTSDVFGRCWNCGGKENILENLLQNVSLNIHPYSVNFKRKLTDQGDVHPVQGSFWLQQEDCRSHLQCWYWLSRWKVKVSQVWQIQVWKLLLMGNKLGSTETWEVPNELLLVSAPSVTKVSSPCISFLLYQPGRSGIHQNKTLGSGNALTSFLRWMRRGKKWIMCDSVAFVFTNLAFLYSEFSYYRVLRVGVNSAAWNLSIKTNKLNV